MSRPARRVALVFASLAGGGIERSMLRLARALIGQGLAVDLVVGKAEGELLADVPAEAGLVDLGHAPLWPIRLQALKAEPSLLRLVIRPKLRPLKSILPLRQLPGLVRYFRTAAPAAVLSAEPKYNLLAIWARRLTRLRARVVVSERDQVSSPEGPRGAWRERQLQAALARAYLEADAIVAISDGLADDLATVAGISRQRITTVYNPVVGPELMAKAQEPLAHPWFAPDAPPVVLGVGRLAPQKDFATLIRAFARLRAERPARLMILGAADPKDRAEETALRALVAERGLAPDVELAGFRHNPFAYMARAAVFVLSSAHEGLGNVLIEALACGCPVVSTDCPSGPAEILEGGRFGPLVPVGDDAAMASAIAGVLDQPPAAAMLAERARQFTIEQAARHYRDLLLGPGQGA